MSLSPRALETLIDLVEIKLSCLEVFDREDARERDNLQHCLTELSLMAGVNDEAFEGGNPVVAFPEPERKRQRAVAAG